MTFMKLADIMDGLQDANTDAALMFDAALKDGSTFADIIVELESGASIPDVMATHPDLVRLDTGPWREFFDLPTVFPSFMQALAAGRAATDLYWRDVAPTFSPPITEGPDRKGIIHEVDLAAPAFSDFITAMVALEVQLSVFES